MKTIKSLEGHRWFIWTIVFLVVFMGGLAFYIYKVSLEDSAQSAAPATNSPTGSQAAVPPAGPITVRGEMVCLPHRDTDGPQTMECAFGVKDREGRYFALRDSDPGYRNLIGIPMNVPVEVTGGFEPRTDIRYQSIGVVEVTGIRELTTEE